MFVSSGPRSMNVDDPSTQTLAGPFGTTGKEIDLENKDAGLARPDNPTQSNGHGPVARPRKASSRPAGKAIVSEEDDGDATAIASVMSGALSNTNADEPGATPNKTTFVGDEEEIDFIHDPSAWRQKPYRRSKAGKKEEGKKRTKAKRPREEDSGEDSGRDLDGTNQGRTIAKPRRKRVTFGDGVRGGDRNEASMFDVPDNNITEQSASRPDLIAPANDAATASAAKEPVPGYDAENATLAAPVSITDDNDEVTVTKIINKSNGSVKGSDPNTAINNAPGTRSNKSSGDKAAEEMTVDDIRYLQVRFDRVVAQNEDKTARLKKASRVLQNLEKKVEKAEKKATRLKTS